ncbi:hypothetical protein JTB14_020337 [Gonioctena quinquepunctata]|nr:hypothetical protein JTB14_020337 [Gonioctena quinquepunctata]
MNHNQLLEIRRTLDLETLSTAQQRQKPNHIQVKDNTITLFTAEDTKTILGDKQHIRKRSTAYSSTTQNVNFQMDVLSAADYVKWTRVQDESERKPQGKCFGFIHHHFFLHICIIQKRQEERP